MSIAPIRRFTNNKRPNPSFPEKQLARSTSSQLNSSHQVTRTSMVPFILCACPREQAGNGAFPRNPSETLQQLLRTMLRRDKRMNYSIRLRYRKDIEILLSHERHEKLELARLDHCRLCRMKISFCGHRSFLQNGKIES